MFYNICIVKPNGYPHWEAFTELAEIICYTLQDMGNDALISHNSLPQDARNILIGCHLIDSNANIIFPSSTIILNTEQISEDGQGWSKNVIEWSKRYQVWDYSLRNVDILRKKGANNISYLKIGYHEKLTRIVSSDLQDIDVLFYGSINPRREKILNDLRSSGCRVEAIFNIYGEERDKYISRAKIVLNLHYYDEQIFEIVRVFYLMSNSKAVVCEVGSNTSIDSCHSDGIYRSDYSLLVDSCLDLLREPEVRKKIELQAFECIRKLPQKLYLQDII